MSGCISEKKSGCISEKKSGCISDPHALHCTALNCTTPTHAYNYNHVSLHYAGLHYTTLHYITLGHYTSTIQLRIHYTNYTTPQLQLHYVTITTAAALHHTTSSCSRWGGHCNHCNHSKTQTQPPFSPSLDSLRHPWITTTNLSSGFRILKLPPPPCAVLLVPWIISKNYLRLPTI